jgi:hypothetical protein
VLNNPTNVTDPTGFSAEGDKPAEVDSACTGSRTKGGCGGYSVQCFGNCSAADPDASGNKTKKSDAKNPSANGNSQSANRANSSGPLLGPNGGFCDAGCGESAPKVGDQLAWASQKGFYVHQDAGSDVFGKDIGKDNLKAVDEGHEWADSSAHQTSQYTYIHAMRNPSQTVDQARDASNEFVHNAASMALDAKAGGDMHKAYFWFGVALHTMQDSTSPSHQGFQLRTGNETKMEVFTHVRNEMLKPSSNSDLYQVTRQAWKSFQNNDLSGFGVR